MNKKYYIEKMNANKKETISIFSLSSQNEYIARMIIFLIFVSMCSKEYKKRMSMETQKMTENKVNNFIFDRYVQFE